LLQCSQIKDLRRVTASHLGLLTPLTSPLTGDPSLGRTLINRKRGATVIYTLIVRSRLTTLCRTLKLGALILLFLLVGLTVSRAGAYDQSAPRGALEAPTYHGDRAALTRIWTVDDDGVQAPDADFTAIQPAVNAATAGDTVMVYAGTYSGGITMTKRLTITGDSWPLIDSINRGSGITLRADAVVIEGLEFIRAGARDFYGPPLPTDYPAEIEVWSDENILRNNRMEDSGRALYIGSTAARNTITHNQVMTGYLEIAAGDNNVITHNSFGRGTAPSLIIVDGLTGSDLATGNRIGNNSFSDMGQLTVQVDHYTEATVIAENDFQDCWNGIRVESDNHQILNNTLHGRTALGALHSRGIDVYNANNTLLEGNIVEGFGLGVAIQSVFYGMAHTNTIMRDNHLAGNMYNLAPLFSPGIDYPYPEAFDLDIDTSNTVEGRTVYYLHDVSDMTFSPSTLPDAGFLACINCNNITVTHLSLEGNAHGILLHNVADALIDDVYVYDNYQAGIALYDCENVTIRETQATHNGRGDDMSPGVGYGISVVRSTGCAIEGCRLETNGMGGVSFLYADDNTLRDSQVLDNGSDYSHGLGVWLGSSDGNVVHSNRIAWTVPNEQYDGVRVERYSDDNIVYNNVLQNTRTNVYDSSDHTTWNITKTLGTNIVGGPYLGGNYWHDYAGVDTDGDLIGDTDIPYTAGGEIDSGGDYLPLIPVTLTPLTPTLVISSPTASDTVSRSLPLRYAFDGELTNVTYRLDEGTPAPVDGPTSIDRLTLGEHTLELEGQDQEERAHTAAVTFTVVPLALATEEVGTPDYPDEAAFSFLGRPVSYTLTFQVRNPLGGDLQVHLNRYLDGVMGHDPDIVDYYEGGALLGSLGASENWVTHTFTISATEVSSGWENLISFINLTNAEGSGTPLPWGVRNLMLRPDLPLGMPRIHVESERAFSTGAQMPIWLEIDDVADDGYQAYVYLIDPDGARFYYPDWGEERTPLDHAYVRNNHYGRLPGTYDFGAESVPGTYQLVAELVEGGPDGDVVWSATQSLFFSERNAVKLYLNREFAADGDRLVIESAIAAPEQEDGKLVVSLETPAGQRAYLPTFSDLATVMAAASIVTDGSAVPAGSDEAAARVGSLPAPLFADDDLTPWLYLPIVLRNAVPGPIECDHPLSGVGIDGPRRGETETLHTFTAVITPAGATPPLSYRWSPEPFTGQDTEQTSYEWATPGAYTITLRASNCGGVVSATHLITVETPGITWATPVESLDYAPLADDYLTLFDERVDPRWESGTYVVRGTLYNGAGDPVTDDLVTFDVCREPSGVTGSYFLSSTFDISPTVATMARCDLTLIDRTTLEYLGERVMEGPHTAYTVTATPGAYFLSGICYDEPGARYSLPTTPVSFGCGEVAQRDVKLVHLSDPTTTARAALATPFSAQEASDNDCSNPKVIVFLHMDQEALDYYEIYDGTERSQEQIKADLSVDVFDTLRRRSSGIDLLSGQAIWQSIHTLKKLKEMGRDVSSDLSSLAQAIKNVEYVYWMHIGLTFIDEEDDTGYVIYSSVTDIDSFRILNVTWQDRKGTNLQEGIDLVLFGQGDIGAGIRHFEQTRVTAPRDPKLSITDPPDPVSPEDPETDFEVRAIDCYGNPAYGNTTRREYLVWFPKMTERGEVIGREPNGVPGDERGGFRGVNTNSQGYARADYRLTTGGYEDEFWEYSAGKDRVDLHSARKGRKLEHTSVFVPLIGTRLDLVPRQKEIGVEDETIVDISLINVDENGNETPVAGKPVVIQYDASILRGGRITVLGAKDGAGNPITDQDGKAQIKFKAGKEDGLVSIEVLYQPPGMEQYIEDIAEIQVKKDEFVVRIRWYECGDYIRRSGGDKYDVTVSVNYCFQFNARSIWDRTSKRKKTSADLSFSHDASYERLDGHPHPEDYWTWCETLRTGDASAQISSHLEEEKANKAAFLIERYNHLFMPLDPLRMILELSGGGINNWTYQRECTDGSFESAAGTDHYDQTDWTYSPQPMRTADCVLRADFPSYDCWRWPDVDFPGFGPLIGDMVMLERTGEDSYRAYGYDYSLYRYDEVPPGRPYEYYPEYELERSFGVTVVKR
jgi:parallel beta-helix repeat protein